jgi:uncharacterized phage-associated protein
MESAAMPQQGQEVQFDRPKLKDVVHYIVSRFEDPRDLGNVKLHKILYFSDMLMYAATGAPVTGVEYQKQQFGPVARHLTWALKALAKDGRITARREEYFGFPQLHLRASTPPPLEQLSDLERRLIDDVIDFVRGRSAREISDLSHTAVWESRKTGETIPYFTAFSLVPTVVTDADVAWGVEEARRLVQ